MHGRSWLPAPNFKLPIPQGYQGRSPRLVSLKIAGLPTIAAPYRADAAPRLIAAGSHFHVEHMLAVVKPASAPGSEVREVAKPGIGRDEVLVKVKVASICGTDLHIYNWDQ